MAKITDTQLKQWKSKYGSVYQIEVEDEEKGIVTGFFRKPPLDVIAASESLGKTDIEKALFIFDNCWLGGDEYMRTNDECKFAAAVQVVPLFKIPVATIKKL